MEYFLTSLVLSSAYLQKTLWRLSLTKMKKTSQFLTSFILLSFPFIISCFTQIPSNTFFFLMVELSLLYDLNSKGFLKHIKERVGNVLHFLILVLMLFPYPVLE